MRKQANELKKGEIAKGTVVTISSKYNSNKYEAKVVECLDSVLIIDKFNSEGYGFQLKTAIVEWETLPLANIVIMVKPETLITLAIKFVKNIVTTKVMKLAGAR